MSTKADALWGQPGYIWDWYAGCFAGIGLAGILYPLAVQFIFPHPFWLSGVALAAGLALSVVRATQISKAKREASPSS